VAAEYDGIILGAGHNGLILQAYAQRAGLHTLCLEQAPAWGGGLSTIQHPSDSGFLHNTHSFFHRGLNRMPWYRDLELEKWGARYIEPELNVALLLGDGRSFEWWTDFEKTYQSAAEFSRRDADTLRRWRDRFRPILQQILIPEAQSPPLPPLEREKRLATSADGRLLLETSGLSPVEFVEREFEHPAIRAGLLFFNGLREVDLRARGFGHHIPALLASDSLAQMCVGGARQLAAALVARIQADGGVIICGTKPVRMIIEQSRISGIETADGQRFTARHFVASSLNPQQTFLELLPDSALPAGWRERAAGYQYNLLAPLFGLYLNLSEPPRYRAAARQPHLAKAFMVILGLESSDMFADIVAHHQRGSIPPTVMWGACPTLFDDSQAPAGRHTAFMWEKLPFALRGNPSHWNSEREKHADVMFRLWNRYAPNLAEALLDRFAKTPLEIEQTLPNMRGGDLLVGALAQDQMGWNRPFPGAGTYRTAMAGLYLCGSCCHPGGNITGLPAYNCAQVLLADLEQRQD
jgi:phytoene dehydrogenase-like protein